MAAPDPSFDTTSGRRRALDGSLTHQHCPGAMQVLSTNCRPKLVRVKSPDMAAERSGLLIGLDEHPYARQAEGVQALKRVQLKFSVSYSLGLDSLRERYVPSKPWTHPLKIAGAYTSRTLCGARMAHV
ncbi:hypothetical protein PYCCODRAFT_1097833 [Trametes coccinea BRFM310]|uniref:Uncharacterized protein n=1 Tax=Trametes coccinea (strain BRFM310) TaxID=1353009 RepID=A0A1Y2IBP8_TRAC3|nr:hypothetical protein PYCCODRAFT_1097833 [Trametes coccinea BRFM310]